MGVKVSKKVHLIAVGGAIMHNMAIALQNRGYEVSGSDDAIYDPALSNLKEAKVPIYIGWDADHISTDLDYIILGMHARQDNPEILKAQELGLRIMSFPEFVANESRDKTRLVIAGSHGKTTTTAMIMHVLSELDMDFDYLVGSSIDGFDLSVKLSDAPLIVIEGDEYLSSPLDLRSKFLWYEPHLSIITGIAYDHINVFPTFDLYLDTFDKYIKSHAPKGKYYWFEKDEYLENLSALNTTQNNSYVTPQYEMDSNGSIVFMDGAKYELSVVGRHNLENMRAAQLVCNDLGISTAEFYASAASFTGAGRRMEKIINKPHQVVYRDFAHSPSKLKATTEAVSETYKGELLAVFELHTFSSLNEKFLPLYENSMQSADRAIVFYNSAVFAHRKMKVLEADFVEKCFIDVQIINDVKELEREVNKEYLAGKNILLMSSGTFEKAAFRLD